MNGTENTNSLEIDWSCSLRNQAEINRNTLFGEHELVLTSLFLQWCHEKEIEPDERNDYFLAHINRGVEVLVHRIRGMENLAKLIKVS